MVSERDQIENLRFSFFALLTSGNDLEPGRISILLDLQNN